MFFGWANIKKLILEWLNTFSNKDSRFSSKRITQFTFGAVAVSLTIFVIIYNRDKFTATDDVMVISPLFIYGGYTLNQTQKEKKDAKEDNNSSNSSSSI